FVETALIMAATYMYMHQVYLLHCPCHRCKGFPWQRDTLPLSIRAGKYSAIRWLPECIVHCCCRDLGSPLGTGDRHRVKKCRIRVRNSSEIVSESFLLETGLGQLIFFNGDNFALEC
ncbi:hypothetical protein XENOCAPTIV_021915, partial [Xenoophorus captivus]